MTDTTPPLVALRGIWKVFESVTVLRGIDFEIAPGQVHALLGGNGSGKSTIVKIISGAYTPTAGTVEVNGTPVALKKPSDAHEKGIYMVPQEPHIFPNLTVLENLTMGLAGDRAENARRAEKAAQEIGLEADFSAPGGELSIANQQLVEIVRGLLRNAHVLILDEPTSSLTRREVASLAAQIKHLTAQGIGILFISHRLNEVLDFSDRVSVLRDGHFVLSRPASELTAEQLVEAMLPEDFTPHDADARKCYRIEGAHPVLQVRHLSGQAFRDVNFDVYPGEVVGISGVVGSGRTEFAEAIFGIDTEATGEVVIAGKPAPERSPQICQEMGLSYVPEDRHAHGIFLALPSAQTISSGVMSMPEGRFMSSAEERNLATRFIDKLRIKLSSPMQSAKTLSGGNQQKIVLAKTLAPEPRVVILDEPTRGIDARARQDVYRIIRDLTADGVGVVVISSEVGEISEVSDRVLIMKRGRLVELAAGVTGVEQISAATFDATGGAGA
ncbi:monosaccharide ABC transporter ATP-binding protein (CUT2 family) [Rhodobacter aestuarii]|uniref:Autoinducer 2 import ATP-binding protein LsrA n=1 Tax=Rhodobacter aestuarii TaxID=453582 RepID=A0A1N7P2B2_9RHOB|nr:MULTISPECIES: sugar ABC transporter ATP-binding protein [Rhodobacter]PTV97529.1 monosaccharide ABC transporter ATP-binding protein (CUT2 family) [Rhodobacter aestuarii]SIT04711.1 monosaccharide ABC transporter ATP-binding protein, CUT2 family [Rhodobacter aestuarii]SOC05298.1 monosaccharide ABC transporter ATP-binding protein (CUT2 family) [Rhodobacter sp. JA431]